MSESSPGERTMAESPHELFNTPDLTVEDAARLYGVPPTIIRRAIERGELSLADVAGRQLLSRAAVLAWLKDRRAGWA